MSRCRFGSWFGTWVVAPVAGAVLGAAVVSGGWLVADVVADVVSPAPVRQSAGYPVTDAEVEAFKAVRVPRLGAPAWEPEPGTVDRDWTP